MWLLGEVFYEGRAETGGLRSTGVRGGNYRLADYTEVGYFQTRSSLKSTADPSLRSD